MSLNTTSLTPENGDIKRVSHRPDKDPLSGRRKLPDISVDERALIPPRKTQAAVPDETLVLCRRGRVSGLHRVSYM